MKQHLVITYLVLFFTLLFTTTAWTGRQITVDVTIVNQQNQQIYHSQKSYNDTELPVNDGFSDLYSTLTQNTLYPESSSVLNSLWANLSKDNLLIFDGPLAGIAVHMAPPQTVGNTIIYRGHVVGPKQSDGDGGHLYPRPQCCENVNKGMLMTFTPKQLEQPRTILPVNQALVSAAIYHAGRETWHHKKAVLTESYYAPFISTNNNSYDLFPHQAVLLPRHTWIINHWVSFGNTLLQGSTLKQDFLIHGKNLG